MIHHEIDVQGKIFVQKVTTLPSWTADDERRIILVDANNTFYYGTDIGWVADHKFKSIIIAGQDTIIADNPEDSLTFAEGDGIILTTNAATDAILISQNVLPSNTIMWFWQASAPTGWTIIDDTSDCLLAIKGNSGNYNVTPGSGIAGIWMQPGHAHVGGNHVLTISEMPIHNHEIYMVNFPNSGAETGWLSNAGEINTGYKMYNSLNSGSNESHNHGSTSSAATANTYRPQARVGILAQKD